MLHNWLLPGFSLRGRILALFSVVLLALMLTGSVMLISNARESVKEEIRASEELARNLAIAAITSLARAGETNAILSDLPVQLTRPRHVRILILNSHDEPLPTPALPVGHSTKSAATAPSWFDALIRPPPKIIRIPIELNRSPIGTVVITSEPSDEIAEVWRDFRSLFFLMAAGYAALLLAIRWCVNTALKPLDTISRGLARLEDGDYRARLPHIAVPELTPIGVRFNALAAKLAATIQEKELLHRKLVTTQDSERKNIAHELHDEFGPCLFGIKVDASTIKTAAGKLSDSIAAALVERADAILDIVDHMQKHNRSLLHRLRPMVLGHVSLAELLDKLVSGYRFRHTEIDWRLSVPENLVSYGETTDLTIYRTVQECLTNAARHSQASAVDVSLELIQTPGQCAKADATTAIWLAISDNGCGFDQPAAFGFGLSGLSQRIKALGGRFDVRRGDDGGTTVTVLIPVQVDEAALTMATTPPTLEDSPDEASARNR